MSTRKTLALVVAATTAVAGCALNRSALKKSGEALFSQVGNTGQIIEPKRCLLSVVFLPRPLKDPAVNEGIWSSADEQSIPGETRRVLEANGLRMGILTGGLPTAVEAAMKAPPPNKIEPAEFNLPDGSNTMVSLAEAQPSVSLLINRDGRASGSDYKEASGWFRVTASQEGPTGVSLRLVPEIHHGPVLRRYDALPNNGGTLNTMQFMLKDGQQEDTFRELAATLKLEPGQVAAIGCLPDRPGSLGSFLFTQAEPNSDRMIQKVVLIWATRSSLGTPGSQPTTAPNLEAVDPPDLPAPFRKEKDKDAAATPTTIGGDPLKDRETRPAAVPQIGPDDIPVPAEVEHPREPAKIDDAVTPVSGASVPETTPIPLPMPKPEPPAPGGAAAPNGP